jgi:hypothetical protein
LGHLELEVSLQSIAAVSPRRQYRQPARYVLRIVAAQVRVSFKTLLDFLAPAICPPHLATAFAAFSVAFFPLTGSSVEIARRS